MIYGVILGLLFGVGTIAMLAVGVWGVMDEGTVRKCVGFIIAPIAFILFLCIPFSFHQVDAGEVAVVKHMGQVSNVRTAGTYFDFWMTNKYDRYDAKVQNVDITTQAYSKDAQTMDISMTVQYQIQQDRVKEIASQYGNLSALENRIQNVVIEKTKSVLSKYSAMGIIETRGNISPEVEEVIKEAIDNSYFVSINTVVLSNIDFSDVFEKTVEDKMVAEQEKLKAEYEKEKAEIEAKAKAEVAKIEAEAELEVAKIQAEARITAAKGDAEAQLVIARAEANAIKAKSVEVARALGFKIDETETEDGIEYTINFDGKSEAEIQLITEYMKYLEYLSKWNGELPKVVGDGAGFMFTINTDNLDD